MTRQHAHPQNKPITMQNSSQGTTVSNGDECFCLILFAFDNDLKFDRRIFQAPRRTMSS